MEYEIGEISYPLRITLVLNGITLCVGKEKSSPPIIVPASNRL